MKGTRLIFTLALVIASFAILGTCPADDTTDQELAQMLYRNCFPNGYERSPELYIVYKPDVLTSSN